MKKRLFGLLAGLVLVLFSPIYVVLADGPSPTPQPISSDRLEIPELPDNPTQADFGRVVYYYNCMPCHGDRGQGLTDEWRQVWVEDHQNCWERGCHGGRVEDEGFPIPKSIPPIISSPQMPIRFPTTNDLFEYLRQTHPPQHPGVLSEQDYRAVTAFLQTETNESSSQIIPSRALLKLAGLFLAIFLLASALVLQTRHPRT